uniref:BPTI/Kunitz inhibitor domain-containing protein n=1 Tax=Timema poppense TaxID=170557 RepID=A0A7R9DVJ8_TIMPO|nr:unnamed protein product [Timema poppensis]
MDDTEKCYDNDVAQPSDYMINSAKGIDVISPLQWSYRLRGHYHGTVRASWTHSLPITDDSEAIVLSEGSTLADICLLPADVGPCRAAKPRYYYDIEAKACVKFRYGGCYGNCNNFATVEKCETACPTKIKSFR